MPSAGGKRRLIHAVRVRKSFFLRRAGLLRHGGWRQIAGRLFIGQGRRRGIVRTAGRRIDCQRRRGHSLAEQAVDVEIEARPAIRSFRLHLLRCG